MAHRISLHFLAAATILASATPDASAEVINVAWSTQLGTSETDVSYGVAVDGFGNVFMSGYTYGLLGDEDYGQGDAFLSKFDSVGTRLWTKQLGTSAFDFSDGVAVDTFGNAYITGGTRGALGGSNAGEADAFLAKYDADGNVVWTRQMGTELLERGKAVTVGADGSAYVTGLTHGSLAQTNSGGSDAFLARYDSDGNLIWTRQLGTVGDETSFSVALDASGNAYISGYTDGAIDGASAGSSDAFLGKYDPEGNLLWTRQLGTEGWDASHSVAVDTDGNVYISGAAQGTVNGLTSGTADAFLAKYDQNGLLLWMEQLGTSVFDISFSLALDALGNAYISGQTDGDLGGPNAGSSDVFVAKYDPLGNLLWTEQIGTEGFDRSYGVAVDAFGSIYITGDTDGSLGGPNAGGTDAFLIKLSVSEVPEPSSLIILLGGILTSLILPRLRKPRG